MQVWEFEEEVLRIEEVVIRIRAPVNTEVGDYEYERQTKSNMSVTNWLELRLVPALGEGTQVAVIDGHYTRPHGRTKMGTLRASYER